MCGIAGIWNTSGGRVSSHSLQDMAQSFRHRGPDGEGVWTQGDVGFVHRRLSIIDLSDKGSQPFISIDGRYALVFNGEIYNYKELKEEHFAGDAFISGADTEVLLKLLIRFGKDAIPKLRGMFAFAFFDTHAQEMLLACDPFGKKPLYYTWAEDMLVFSSEIKALFASGYIQPYVHSHAISEYLEHEYVPQPRTAYKNILILGGGQAMRITKDSAAIATWWRPATNPKKNLTFSAAATEFDELLGKAVERRMIADVPVGIFLSGGLDSSAIAWYMRHAAPNAEIHSCSVSFTDASFNEAHYAQIIADRMGTVHHDIPFTYELFVSVLREVIPIIDIPFADASFLPTYVVSKLARAHMAVVLGGDGADELLGGYGTFDAYETHAMLAKVPRNVWHGLEQFLQYILPVSHRYFSLDFKIKSFLRGAQFSEPHNLAVWLGAFTSDEVRSLLVRELPIPVPALSSLEGAQLHPFDRACLLHIRGYLTSDILVKFDRATMAASLEARTPFLDVDLADFVLRLPPAYKKHKRILRHVMQGRLPYDIISRRKQGFGIPLGGWLMQRDSLARAILTKSRIDEVGIFKYQVVDGLLSAHEKGRNDYRKKIWTLMMFQLWYEYWIIGKRDIL